uniref:S-adenosylmethionine:tRNA ribosyltransferase-isomerase n=1 Tax=Solibacter usitatus (strain Ellin6076) TaxID=234267 RepID=QUEA_SOLUE|nr:RecName: Full=S-adenosylmethionine:tRNA ribosyltransferase-isomerase; AltName: Full=Queuosine biosynthesis protein QueA [Candidatus Solibacter usitatus Ellin6076]
MNLSEFDYHLPDELIAQEALADRAASRMLVVHREQGRWEDRCFRDLPEFLRPGDCLVLNDSRVFPARLFGHRSGVHSLAVGKNNPKRHEFLSGAVEVFLLRAVSQDGRDWQALVRPGRKMRTGERIVFDEGLEAEIIARGEFGERTVRFLGSGDLYAAFDRIGHVPLPPYIKRDDSPADRERYQTVFAREKGSVAAPTAGLHFTPEVIERCQAAGADVATVTLHVGLGTFQPLHQEVVEEVKLHTEHYRITADNAGKIGAATRVVAVGTTSVRTLETAARDGVLEGETDIFLYPGVPFRRTGAMLTNFHLPRTSLLVLVSAFAGKDLMLAAYRHAVEARYRFYSYGDCMLIV